MSASSLFGAMFLCGSFQISGFPAGSKAALTSTTSGGWNTAPFAASSFFRSDATIVGADPAYDFILPVHIDGSFVQTGVALGLSYSVSALISGRAADKLELTPDAA